MVLSRGDALLWIERIISIAIIFQSLELLLLRETTSDKGVWSWGILKKEFEFLPISLQKVLEVLLKYPNFNYVLAVRLASAILILFFPTPIFMFLLLFSTVLTLLRWLGTFNGGSDFMTLVVLMALCVATSFEGNSKVETACLWYISIQTCTSYFIAGVAKLKSRNWRTGRALIAFMSSTIYGPSPVLPILNSFSISLILSWFVIALECSFPVALLNSEVCTVFIGLAVIFHLANFYFFGLNRFLFAWAAVYPALLYCSAISIS